MPSTPGAGDFAQVMVEVDLWGDGVPDSRTRFGTATGMTEELLRPVLDIRPAGPGELLVSWLDRTNWSLRTSPTLGGWDPAPGTTVDGGVGQLSFPWVLPDPIRQRYFRLQKDAP